MCKARRYCDQIICGRCGYQWDVSDVEPPTCKTLDDIGKEKIKEVLSLLTDKKNPTKK